jgi:hypothetical protein
MARRRGGVQTTRAKGNEESVCEAKVRRDLHSEDSLAVDNSSAFSTDMEGGAS